MGGGKGAVAVGLQKGSLITGLLFYCLFWEGDKRGRYLFSVLTVITNSIVV